MPLPPSSSTASAGGTDMPLLPLSGAWCTGILLPLFSATGAGGTWVSIPSSSATAMNHIQKAVVALWGRGEEAVVGKEKRKGLN